MTKYIQPLGDVGNTVAPEITLHDRVTHAFQTHFGYKAQTFIQAPGRVNLIGEHTDYNDGFVLPCAINFHTFIAASKRDDMMIRVVAVDYHHQQDIFSLTDEITPHPDYMWANYVRGVLKHLQVFMNTKHISFQGADLVIGGNIPQGAGLSSSASLEVAVGKLFQELYNLPLSGTEIAQNGQSAENQFVGCQCGIMDQMISSLGQEHHALLLDCKSLETHLVTIPKEAAIVIIHSNVKRGLVDSEYNTRRIQCETAAHILGVPALRDADLAHLNAHKKSMDPIIFKRAHHIITENARTLEAADALAHNDFKKISTLMRASHVSMRDDFEITEASVDILVEIVQNVIGEQGGVRMTGGGFGGCIVALVPKKLVPLIKQHVENQYFAKTGIKETFYMCDASEGAGAIYIK